MAPKDLTKADTENVAQIVANGGNLSEVARALGMSPTEGPALDKVIRSHGIQDRAVELIQTKFARHGITGDRVMTELARLAFASAKDMFDADGRPLGIHEMDDDVAATIVAFDVEERVEGRGNSALPCKVMKIRRGDKLGALNILAKHFKLVNDDDGVNALAGALADRLNAAKRRVVDMGSTSAEDAEIIGTLDPTAQGVTHEIPRVR